MPMCDTNSELACCYHSFNVAVPFHAGSSFATDFDHQAFPDSKTCEQLFTQQEGVQTTRLSDAQKAQDHRPCHHSEPETECMTVLCLMHDNKCSVVTCMQSRDSTCLVVTCMQSRDSKHVGGNAADAHQAYAGPNPWAVVVKLLHTVVAYSTVGAARRSPMIAGGAPFGLNHKAIDLVLLVCWPTSASTHSLRKANCFDACCFYACCPLWAMLW